MRGWALSGAALPFLAMVLVALAGAAEGQETVTVTLPPAVSFQVIDVGRSTSGSPSPTPVEYRDAMLVEGSFLRILVRAESPAFVPPADGGTTIAASGVRWTVGGTSGGTGHAGTLQDGFSTLVFESTPGATSGGTDVSWHLDAPGPGIRAGDHALTVVWTLESIHP